VDTSNRGASARCDKKIISNGKCDKKIISNGKRDKKIISKFPAVVGVH